MAVTRAPSRVHRPDLLDALLSFALRLWQRKRFQAYHAPQVCQRIPPKLCSLRLADAFALMLTHKIAQLAGSLESPHLQRLYFARVAPAAQQIPIVGVSAKGMGTRGRKANIKAREDLRGVYEPLNSGKRAFFKIATSAWIDGGPVFQLRRQGLGQCPTKFRTSVITSTSSPPHHTASLGSSWKKYASRHLYEPRRL